MILPAVRERLETVLRHPSMDGAIAALRAGGQHISLASLHDVAKALVAAYIAHELRRPAFFVTDSNRRAEALADTLRFFSTIFPSTLGGVATLPASDTLPWQSQSPHADILERRATTLFRLTDGQIALLVAPVSAALWRYQDPYVYLSLARTLATDAEIPLEELITHVGSVGYTRTEMVEMPGQFAVRGGIVDLFSPESPRPVRIELLGDAVESVREFDPRTQRSIAPVVRTTLLPLTEWAVPAENYFWNEEQFAAALEKTSQVNLEPLALGIGSHPQFELSSRPSARFHGDVVACMNEVKSQVAAGGRVFLTAVSTGELERLADICREYEVPYVLGESEDAAAGFTAETAQESAGLLLMRSPFAEGVAFPEAKVTLYGNADLFEVMPALERPGRKIRTSGFFTDFAELKPGDFVVHVDHGIGQFEGLRQIESHGHRSEFMLLGYAEDSRLYFPLERMDLVHTYRVVEGAHPALDKLG